MPPASRGLLLGLRQYTIRKVSCRNASSTPPPSAPKLPNRLRTSHPTESRAARSRTEHTPEDGSQTSQPRGGIFRRFKSAWLRLSPNLRRSIYTAVIAMPISAFVIEHIVPFGVWKVTGPSMSPTINPDCESSADTDYTPTWVLVRSRKFDPNYLRELRKRAQKEGQSATGSWARGEIIMFETPHDPDKLAVKRIVGVAGDVVTPLKGYPGGEESVVIPYNHLWVEGDANDRKKSQDSNYFGPISIALVRGQVIAIPWWNLSSMHHTSSDPQSWPARRQKRVMEDAVHDASAHPDTISSVKPFEGDRATKMLNLLREHPQDIEDKFRGTDVDRNKIVKLYVQAFKVAKHHPDAETQQRARDIVREFERIIGKNALREAAKPSQGKRRRIRGELNKNPLDDPDTDVDQVFSGAVAHEDERAAQREIRAAPAKAALEEMLKQKRQYGEMIDREFEERDKVREAKEF